LEEKKHGGGKEKPLVGKLGTDEVDDEKSDKNEAGHVGVERQAGDKGKGKSEFDGRAFDEVMADCEGEDRKKGDGGGVPVFAVVENGEGGSGVEKGGQEAGGVIDGFLAEEVDEVGGGNAK